MSTYSSNLRIELITTGTQAGTWGNTTNDNYQYILEQAIAGNVSVAVVSANQALTYLNGPTSTASANQSVRAILTLSTSTTADFAVYAPPVSKQYTIYNSSAYTATIYNSTVIGNTTAAGTGIAIPPGKTMTVWSNGTNFYQQNTYLNSPTINTPSIASPTLTGTPTAPTAAPGTNTTQIATTAFTAAAITAATGSLGTMSTQNANSVAITGGSITGITDLAVADGGTGASNASDARANLGLAIGTDIPSKTGTGASGTWAINISGNAATASNGGVTAVNGQTGSVTVRGLGIGGEVWNDVTGSRSFGVQYTNSRSYPIAVSARTTCSGGSYIEFVVDGMAISNFNWQWNGCGSFGGGFVIVPPGKTYQLNSGQGLNYWRELY